jgi:hypothetical protein
VKKLRRRSELVSDIIPELLEAQSVEDIGALALRVLKSLPPPVAMVCGPLTTGGGEFEANRRKIRKAISLLRHQETIFDQLIFLGRSDRLHDVRWRLKLPFIGRYFARQHRLAMREAFHLPLLRSRLIKEIFFLPGWESSEGSRWYHDRAKELGIRVQYLKEEDFSAR